MKNYILISLTLVVLGACISNNNKKEQTMHTQVQSPIEQYLSYTKGEVFDSTQYLKDISGHWVCFNYDSVKMHSNFYHNEALAKEIKEYFSFTIKNDTIQYNIYKMPLQCKRLISTDYFKRQIKSFALLDSCTFLDFAYIIRGKNGMPYGDYALDLLNKGDSIPYLSSPLGGWMWCFPKYIALKFYGYNYYFKKGEPKHKDIIGMPSNSTSRFIVNNTYKNCTINEAVYKLIEDFPYGTMGILLSDDEPDMDGNIKTWFPEKFEKAHNYGGSTEYIWHSANSVTVKIPKNRNTTFVFEIVKKGADVHVKYWNDVVYSFEEGYDDSGYQAF